MTGFKRAPASGKPEPRDESAFIAAAGRPAVTTVDPWEGLDDKHRHHLFNIRQTAAEKAKLEHVVANTKFKSMQEYCLHYLNLAIEADIARLKQSSPEGQ